MKKYNVIDLFAGAGGLSYGFYKNEKFNIIAANELEKDMCRTYEYNHPDVKVYCKDIKDFSINDLEKDLNVKETDIDIIIGGPPCQAYSTVGKRLLDDPRGKLFQEFFRIVQETKPKIFLFENVKGLISMNKGTLLPHIISLFEQIGYTVSYKVLNALDYGAPQNRERVILVGTNHLNNKEFIFPETTHCNIEPSKQNYLTISDAISDLPSLGNNDKCDTYLKEPITDYQKKIRNNSNDLIDHFSPNNNEKLIKLMNALPDGGSPEDIPIELRPKSGFKNTYCRLWWNKPSTTLTRNFGTPSSSRCIHPIDPRPLSTREGARIQTFPDTYRFFGSKSSKNLQIGNAVPPILSEHLSQSILTYLE